MATPTTTPHPLQEAVTAARAGDLAAFRILVEATREMAYAVAWQVLRKDPDARDVVQDAYLVAFRHLAELENPEAFAGWLRRIVVGAALNARRRGRATWLPLEDAPAPPVLDAAEQSWTPEQQRLLARALLSLPADERRVCERHYHGGWTAERLARDAGVDPAAMRKRLQRIREKLRKEIEMDERKSMGERAAPDGLPEAIVELLARPRLVDLPENPVGAVTTELADAFAGFSKIDLPEELDLAEAERTLGGDAVYIERDTLQRIEGERVLRYDLTLPLLLSVRFDGRPLRLRAAGKVYRRERETTTHLSAFHQLELFAADSRGTTLDCFWLAGRIMAAVDRVLPAWEIRVTPTSYPMCARAFSLDVKKAGVAEDWVEVLAWGEYAPWVLRALGANPDKHVALGAGIGLERMATLRYGIDDIRKVATAKVA
jgi:RNA polymerase sigma factor (sigma-70 family)